MDAIDAFMQATGQVVNLKKTKTFGPQGGANIFYKGTPVPKTDAVKILGVTWQFRNQNLDLQVNPEKVKTAIALAHRIRYAELPFHLRNALIGSLVMSKILYGIEILDLSLADERKLRTAIGFSIWQKSSKQRSLGLLLTLTCKGHVVDPTQAPHVRRLTAFNRSLKADKEVRKRVMNIVRQANRRRTRTGGFVENIMYTLKRLNVTMTIDEETDNIILDMADERLNLKNTPPSTWAHNALEAAQRAVWRSIDHKRVREGRPAWGLAAGIDTEQTMQWYRTSQVQMLGVLRKILLNAVCTQARRAKMPVNDPDPTCACGREKEYARHLWWRCERWATVRENYNCIAVPYDTFSVALRDLGVKLKTDNTGDTPVSSIKRMMCEICIARFTGV